MSGMGVKTLLICLSSSPPALLWLSTPLRLTTHPIAPPPCQSRKRNEARCLQAVQSGHLEVEMVCKIRRWALLLILGSSIGAYL